MSVLTFLAIAALFAGLLTGPSFYCRSAPGDADEFPNLSGVWAFAQVTSEIVELPLIGARDRTATTLLRTVITQDGNTLTAWETNCATYIDYKTSLVVTTIPPGFLESLGANERFATLAWIEQEGASADDRSTALQITFPWDVQVAGVRLDDIENELLPTDADDSRVIDQDADGHPGVSVHVEILGLIKGDVYVAQRNWTRLVGTLIAPDTIRGTIEWKAEQTVLGASSSWLAQSQLGTPAPERSFFVAKRVSPGMDCARIEALDLFTPLYPDLPPLEPPDSD